MREISRIVTLETSGTTATPKRICYTEEDQELTIDFFHHGMRNLVDTSDVVLIMMPCARPGSVGDLLDIGLRRLGSATVPYGPLKFDYQDIPDVLRIMEREGVTCIVGSPTQVDELAKTSAALGEKKRSGKKTLLILLHR
ncbi:AMP-binding protein [uncultured Sphaerochaeta sp.]|uniref:AMP-binding protein n=1 Tax=uncultured Sphaerochaeta sp. TaxID=886478 RepID=UPI002A0A833E|nr:AMP-binding protein [uncultured Sphaerochaeta sp.]